MGHSFFCNSGRLKRFEFPVIGRFGTMFAERERERETLRNVSRFFVRVIQNIFKFSKAIALFLGNAMAFFSAAFLTNLCNFQNVRQG